MDKIINKIMIISAICMIIGSIMQYFVGDGTTPAWYTTVWASTTLTAYMALDRYEK